MPKEIIIGNVSLSYDMHGVTPDNQGLVDKAKASERYARLDGKKYPLTCFGKILAGKNPVKGIGTVWATVDIMELSNMEYFLGIDKAEIPTDRKEVELGGGAYGVVTSVILPRQPRIHAHTEEDFGDIKKGTILDFDFSRSKADYLKELFDSLKKKIKL